MTYHKFFADQVFDGFGVQESRVLILDEQGTVQELVSAEEAGDDIIHLNGMLTPGLINAHCHLELSHMKGRIPEGTGLVDFVFKVVTERQLAEEMIQEAIGKAEAEMIANGIVAVGDICNNDSTLGQKELQHLNYYNFVEASGWLPDVALPRIERAKSLATHFARFDQGHTAVVPHAPYSVSEALWQKLQPLFKDRIVSIHNQETRFEDELFKKGSGDFSRMYQLMNMDTTHFEPSGRSSLQTYFSKLSEASKRILVHNTFTQQEDLDFIRKQEQWETTWFCLCINANQYIERAVPPVKMLRRNGSKIVLGTDSLASNRSLNIMDEIKTFHDYFPDIPLPEMLQWATLNGAEALGFGALLGSFEKGKRPGVNLLDPDTFQIRKLA
ncbi:MAG TPA: amidohydrolase family protein [Flavisolibacter sp.]|nr:amidohydrolase family protein [Flavisolibacter sp.]